MRSVSINKCIFTLKHMHMTRHRHLHLYLQSISSNICMYILRGVFINKCIFTLKHMHMARHRHLHIYLQSIPPTHTTSKAIHNMRKIQVAQLPIQQCMRNNYTICIYIYIYIYNPYHPHIQLLKQSTICARYMYGVASVNRIDKIIGLFCKRAL